MTEAAVTTTQAVGSTGAAPDYWRQLDVFNPEAFNEEIHIIGVGATGSWIAYLLAKMGVRQIHVYDFDIVEPHNLPNQVYGRQDVGKFKVEALAERLDADCGTSVIQHNERVDGSQKFSGIVFLCTDSMSSRAEIWNNAIKLKLSVKLMVETRLGAEIGMVHVVRPMVPADIRGFTATLVSDGDAEESACTYRAIATTVAAIASIASHKVVKFAKNLEISPVVTVEESPQGEGSDADMLCINPLIITNTTWSAYNAATS